MQEEPHLLRQRRFLPFFLTQFWGAFNDNVFKNALVILIAYKVVTDSAHGDSNMLVNLAFGLFILPFFLFSAFAGQVADKYEKSMLIRRIKAMEIIIMLLAAVGFWFQNVPLLLLVLFLMGTQSTLFGPVKYGLLPQHLKPEELVTGNAWIESSTFLAILIGTIAGGILVAFDSPWPVMVAVVFIALMGFISSRFVPVASPADPNLELNPNVLAETWRNLKFLPGNRVVFLAILGISWFWFYGAIFLAQVPNFSKNILHGDEHVVTLLLAGFSIGIGLGAWLCNKLSGHRVEIGLVPLGAIGMTVFGLDLYFASQQWLQQPPADVLGLREFIRYPGAWRVVLDMVFIGVSGGLFIVPLYALVQERGDRKYLSRIIAGNNIINALFMVVSALMAIVLLSVLHLDIPTLFLVTAVLNILVSIYIFTLVPEFLMRLLAWLLVQVIYRVKAEGLENIPDEGPAVLVCNHISFVDPVIVGGYVRRPVRFVMHYKIFNAPLTRWLFKSARAIPIAGKNEDPAIYERAFAEIRQALADGDLVCIFPEGRLTPDGSIQPFRSGIERILAETPVPVIPVALDNLWGSMFSRYEKNPLKRRPKKLWARIYLRVGKPLPPEKASKECLQKLVAALKNGSYSEEMMATCPEKSD
jgi:1-acyl-sn-glycerol-3-phosphate acyltransferase